MACPAFHRAVKCTRWSVQRYFLSCEARTFHRYCPLASVTTPMNAREESRHALKKQHRGPEASRVQTSAEVLSLDVVRAACTPLEAAKAGSPLSLTGDVLRRGLKPTLEAPSAVLADASAACLQQLQHKPQLAWLGSTEMSHCLMAGLG